MTLSIPASGIDTGVAATATTLVDRRSEIVGRLERLSFSRAHLKLGVITASGLFFDGFDGGLLAVTMTVIFTEFHIGMFNTGVLLSSTFAGQFVGSWLFGFLSEIYGRKNAFLSSMFLYGLLSIGSALAWDFQSLVWIRTIQGLGLGGILAPAVALFSEFMRADRRGTFAGIFQTSLQWGVLLSPVAGIAFFQLFGKEIGWHAVFLFGGIPALIAIYGWFALPESPRWLADRGRFSEAEAVLSKLEAQATHPLGPINAVPVAAPKRTNLAELFSPMYWRRTLVLWVGWSCTYFVVFGLSMWLPSLYVRVGGLPVNDALWLTVLGSVVRLATMYSQALVVDRFGRKRLFLVGFVTQALANFIGAAVLLWVADTTWQMLFIVTTTVTIGTSLTNTLIVNYTAELYPTRLRSLGISAGNSASRIASVIAPAAVGALLSTHLGVQSIFVMFGCVSLIAAVVLPLWGIETKQRVLEDISP